MVVDHRPRTLAILGVTQEEKEELMPHFVVRSTALGGWENTSWLSSLITPAFVSQKFGEVEELRDQDATSVVMTFKTRSEAENVMSLFLFLLTHDLFRDYIVRLTCVMLSWLHESV